MSEYFGGKKFHFLVVDDDPAIRDVIRLHLEHEGHKITLAVDGDDCIKKLTPDINVILLDVKMPGMKSKDIVNEVKTKNPKTVIIYLTSVNPFESTKKETKMGWVPVLEAPVIGYIQKPLTRDDFFTQMEDILARKYLKLFS